MHNSNKPEIETFCFDWRQGHILNEKLSLELLEQMRKERLHNPISPDDICNGNSVFVVLSQDCDLVNGKYEQDSKNSDKVFSKEPFVEFIFGRRSQDVKKVATPRLTVTRLTSGNPDYYSFEPWDRYVCQRKWLCLRQPVGCSKMDEACLKCVIRMITRRYDRIAFPDTFNQRIQQGKIRKYLQNNRDILSKVTLYIQLSSYEENCEIYRVFPLVLLPDIGAAGVEMKDLDNIKEIISGDGSDDTSKGLGLIGLLENCPGIEVENDHILAEQDYMVTASELDLATFREFDAWSFDDLSPNDDDEKSS